MKKLFNILGLICLFTTGSAHSSHPIDGIGITSDSLEVTSLPTILAVDCPRTVVLVEIGNPPGSAGGEGLANIICYPVTASETTTTIALLKELEAAQPDALEYMAGSAPSPLLYSTIKKVQDFVEQKTGEQIDFEEAVNFIVADAL